METLLYEILGKRYILVDVPFVSGLTKKSDQIVSRHGLLYQGVKNIDRGGIFDPSVVVQTFFCPEENYIEFSKEKIS